MNTIFKRTDYLFIILIFILVFLFYWARQSFVSIPSFLFAEDGSIALSGIYKDGFVDIFEPYYGYLHIYSKLVASITYLTDISYAPIIFLMAYLIPLFIFVYLLYAFILSLNGSRLFTVLLTLTVFLMPYTNELILNVTYIKWYMYILLILYIIYDDAEKVLTPYIYYPTYSVFILGGFISVFLAPLIVFKIFIDKYILKLKIKASSIFICCITLLMATVQIITMLSDIRFEEPVKNSLLLYLELLSRIFLLGGNMYPELYILGIIFSTFLIYLIYKFIRSYIGENKKPKDRRFYLFLYIVVALCIYMPSFYTIDIANISGVTLGSRYLFPVFILISILIPILTNRKLYISIFISCILLINVSHIIHSRLIESSKLYSYDLIQLEYPFYEFVKFAKVEKDIIIPINPPYDNIWNLDIHNNERKLKPLIFNQDTQINANQVVSMNIYQLASTNCSNAKDIGVKFYISSSSDIEEKKRAIIRIVLLNKFTDKELPLKPYRFTDNLAYPLMVDGKQQPIGLDKEQDIMIYPVALNINEYNNLIIQTMNAPVMIDKLELFCLD